MKNIVQKIYFQKLTPVVFGILLITVGCENFTETELPRTEMSTESVFTDEKSTEAVISGIYSRMISSLGFAGGYFYSITNQAGLSSGELMSLRPPNAFQDFTLTSDDTSISNYLWNEPYSYIYTVNNVLEAVENDNHSTAENRNRISGEAHFIRAFCYFYLINMFGDVPLHLTTDYQKNSTASRTDTKVIYDQIIKDLLIAVAYLPEDYTIYGGERIRPTTAVAKAFLSRVYLYTENWNEAERLADEVIRMDGIYALTEDLNQVFLKDSKEAIWQLKPVRSGLNTFEGFWFIPPGNFAVSAEISDELLMAFESGDKRVDDWINTADNGQFSWSYPYKYKIRSGAIVSEYSVVIRLAELLLIRAEARAQTGKFQESLSDVNIIRDRAGLSALEFSTSEALLQDIYKERELELFAEWGHRWFDLKRTGRAEEVLGSRPNWNESRQLYPIPLDEITRNSNISQNPGY
ncbi:RagB/SusD family nutrient uptake outer membrane protein [Robertkochia solimangrovi]|uniref:RagB/SusD family nutrient uptake outer membrane protein n=1 Tax=Robertkochia solimangrovi TaxID=2213046 RepID=UPI00117DFCEA|nr:RagB/SusD family nutrient uptake outer membrane protein [Robertkochia solimangrovi]TRZ46094.1 RagB/SusD family nutrient uptake outer membrane protein [Robertkochia solimangrovi]